MLQILAASVALAASPVAIQGAPDPHRPTPVIDTTSPDVPAGLRNGVLIVSKTNAWRHLEHIPHSNRVLADLAGEAGRAAFVTENAAVFTDAALARFRVVILNSASGSFLTVDQRGALDRWLSRGGGLIALHAAADGSHDWPRYRERVIGAAYAGHPGGADQFQAARVIVDQPRHPVMRGVPREWAPIDEWYSYKASPRGGGMAVLARIDEASYRPGAGRAMGADHPIVWTSRWGRGRVVTSTIGHLSAAYDDPVYRRLLANALRWVARH